MRYSKDLACYNSTLWRSRMSWENQNRRTENDKSVDLDSGLVGQALNLMTERHKCCHSSTAGSLPPELDSRCINLLESEPNNPSIKVSVEVTLCVAYAPRPGDPPPKMDLCVAYAPRPWHEKPSHIEDHMCVARPWHPKPGNIEDHLCVAKFPDEAPPRVSGCVNELPHGIPKDWQQCVAKLPEVPPRVSGCVNELPHGIPKDWQQCVARLPEVPPTISGCINRLPHERPSEVVLCTAKMPQPGDPPVEVMLCTAKMPQPGDPPPEIVLCTAKVPTQYWNNGA